mgnify:CR=1 FL=1
MKKSPSLIYLAASADSALDSNGQARLFEQLPSVNENPSPKPSSKSTGRIRQSTTISKPSTQMSLEESISSAAVYHASPGARQGSARDQKIARVVTSGRKWLPLLKSYGLNLQLSKMCEVLLTNRWVSPGHLLIWSASDIKQSLFLSLRLRSERRTGGIECSLWPTPNTCDATRGSPETPEKQEARGANAGWSLIDVLGYTPHPEFVEWLMGFPIGWTDLDVSEPPSCRNWSSKSDAESSQEDKNESCSNPFK